MTPSIYTIGYEGSDSARLLKTLSNVGVEVLADVRELPLSRKKGLSKTSLAETLEVSGIKYRHFRDLGDPKGGRNAARRGEWSKFENIFLNHFYGEAPQKAFQELLEIARHYVVCMLCFEKCASYCHRSYIADEACRCGFEVYNLAADRPDFYLRNDLKIPRYHPRQGISAAE